MNTSKPHEKQIKEAIKKMPLAKPSTDFVANVMQKIEASEKATAYKPVISAKGWLAVAATTVIFVVCASLFSDGLALPAWLQLNEFSTHLTLEIPDTISLSKNAIYGILLTVVAVLLQIPLLESRYKRTLWNNRY